VLGAWLGVWTPPREADVPPIPWRKVALGAAAVAVAAGLALRSPRAVAAASGAMRTSLCHSTRFSLPPTSTSIPAPRRIPTARSSSASDSVSEAIVMRGGALASTIWTRPGLYAW
jgi:hypothetical protein